MVRYTITSSILATRRRIELLCPARQAGIMTIILTSLKLVDAVGLEPTIPEVADLQSAGVTNFPTSP